MRDIESPSSEVMSELLTGIISSVADWRVDGVSL